MTVFERGDVLQVCLQRNTGDNPHQEMGYCLVLSTGQFNELGVAVVAPITVNENYARFGGFAVDMAVSGTKTQGVVLANGIRSVNLAERNFVKIEEAPLEIVNEVLSIVAAILE